MRESPSSSDGGAGLGVPGLGDISVCPRKLQDVAWCYSRGGIPWTWFLGRGLWEVWIKGDRGERSNVGGNDD